MLNRFTSLLLAAAIVCTLCGTSAFASTPAEPDSKAGAAAPARIDSGVKAEAASNEQLRADMLKLVASARAGKIMPAMRPQIQPPHSNGLTKGQKIAIGAGIAAAVIVAIVVGTRLHNEQAF